MQKILAGAVAALAIASTTLVAVTPADAQWRGRHHHRGWGGPGIGFAAGALLGGALAARPYYGPNYYYGPAPYAYDVEPEVEVDSGGDSVAYCMQRFKSYDVRSGTYLGYDGLRHPCP